jgi:hypothetical protein
MLRDRLLTELLRSVNANSVSLGTGLILIRAPRRFARSRSATSRVYYYLGFICDFTQFFRRWRITNRPGWRSAHGGAAAGRAAGRLVAHRSLPVRPAAASRAAGAFRSTSRRSRQTAVLRRHSRQASATIIPSRRGIANARPQLSRGTFTVVTGGSARENDPAGRCSGCCQRTPARSVERRAGRRLERFCAPPRTLHQPGAGVVQRDAARERWGCPRTDALTRRRQAVFEEDLAGMPLGLETPLGPAGVRLSGGQAQRWRQRACSCAARAAGVRRPPGALDVETERALERLAARPGAPRWSSAPPIAAPGGRVSCCGTGAWWPGPLEALLKDCAGYGGCGGSRIGARPMEGACRPARPARDECGLSARRYRAIPIGHADGVPRANPPRARRHAAACSHVRRYGRVGARAEPPCASTTSCARPMSCDNVAGRDRTAARPAARRSLSPAGPVRLTRACCRLPALPSTLVWTQPGAAQPAVPGVVPPSRVPTIPGRHPACHVIA